ncbi:hypothetical protein SD70_05785 [Gordoniibacillus kamchatkensis]|uniref:ABC transporter substrate-binding protein n=1 Tax=Gordoniibacillus kamchatkensis TaxID=1590651 RepID=A0ABR5AKV9_9BACL|nr:extracellular solute-binding protein [Paenibacillus sp. VKM B-2647]KIL41634.1 hypothetical protein SD70_05785 [Paenibacillus sp. VKM B-2647]
MKKTVSIILSVGLLSSMLAGCMSSGKKTTQAAGGTGGDASPKSGITIRIASAETGAEAMKALTDAGAEYEKKTGVKVIAEAVPLNDMYTKINATYFTSAQYNAFLTGYIGHIIMLQKLGRLEPVDDIINSLGGKKDFYDGQILFPIEGKTYWIPYDYNLAYGYIRKDWLQEKGLSVPKTWDELIQVAKAFTDKSKNKFGLIMPLKNDDSTNWVTTSLLWSNDVHIFDDKWNVVLDSPQMKPKAVEALNTLKQLYPYMPEKAVNASYADLTEAFIGDQVGMTFYSGRLVDLIEAKNKNLSDKFEVFGIPTKDGKGVAATLGYDGIGILKTDHSDETKKFVEWFYKEKLLSFLGTFPVHYFPAQKSIYENETWRSLPNIKKYWDSGVKPQYDLLKNAKLNSIDSDGPAADERPATVFQSLVFPKMFQRITVNNEDPGKVVDDTANEIRSMLKKQ